MLSIINGAQGINLQATLSASSATPDLPAYGPHHPITCQSRLFLHEDGTLECEHAVVPPQDHRTQYCLDHSIAILLMECAYQKFMAPPPDDPS